MRLMYGVVTLFFAVFLTLQLLLYLQVQLPLWIVAYVNDFLCMPLVLTACLKVLHLVKQDNKIRISLLPILTLTTFYALYFEVYLPKDNSRYTADFIDVLMYFSGSFFFYFLQYRK